MVDKKVEINKQSDITRLILDTTLDGYILADSKGNISDVNPAYCQLSGYSRSELLKMNIRDLDAQILPEEVERRIQQMFKQGNDRFETKHRRKDGHILDFDTSIAVLHINDKPLIAAFMRNISEHKQALLELKEKELFLSESQEIARIGSYVLDIPAGKWSSTKVLDDILGIEEGFKYTIEGWVSIIDPEWQQKMLDYFTYDVLVKKEPFNKEYKIVRRNDGAQRWVHGMGALKFNNLGEPISMIGTIQDVTESKQAEIVLLLG